MAKKSKGRWRAPFEVGGVRFSVPGKTKAAAKRNRSRFIKKHMKNIEQGFFSGGVFHPIRGSSDYSRGRAGEKPRRKFSHAKAVTRRARPMH
jgi:hypothetical protein